MQKKKKEKKAWFTIKCPCYLCLSALGLSLFETFKKCCVVIVSSLVAIFHIPGCHLPDLFWEGLSLLQFWVVAKPPCFKFYNELWKHVVPSSDNTMEMQRYLYSWEIVGHVYKKKTVQYVVFLKRSTKTDSIYKTLHLTLSRFSTFTVSALHIHWELLRQLLKWQ